MAEVINPLQQPGIKVRVDVPLQEETLHPPLIVPTINPNTGGEDSNLSPLANVLPWSPSTKDTSNNWGHGEGDKTKEEVIVVA